MEGTLDFSTILIILIIAVILVALGMYYYDKRKVQTAGKGEMPLPDDENHVIDVVNEHELE